MNRIKSKYGDCLLSCVIAADTHIDTEHPIPAIPVFLLKRALADCRTAKTGQDAFIIIGDMTSNGNANNWTLFEKCFKGKASPAKNVLLPIGNHDTWNDAGFETAVAEYNRAIETVTGKKPEKTYFSKEINGFRFIFTGSTYKVDGYAGLGQEQLEWLDGELREGTRDGKPVFVFNHEPINCTHGLPLTADKEERPERPPEDGGIGKESPDVERILKKYKNVFYFSGHSHMGFCGEKRRRQDGYSSFEEDGGITLVNLPSNACGNHHGESNRNCVGAVLEVYADKVVIRPRDFLFGKWFTAVTIKDGKTWYEKKNVTPAGENA